MSHKLYILTSSRADYGIYRPLLEELNRDGSFYITLVVFGTHHPESAGTLKEIEQDAFFPHVLMRSFPDSDGVGDVARSYARTTELFVEFWERHQNGVVVALGDRYEMCAAVLASVPYQLKIVHLHGGEDTFGAFDNVYRNAISGAAHAHFVSAAAYGERVKGIVGASADVVVTGALAADAIKKITIMTREELLAASGVDFSVPTLLCTFHPETAAGASPMQDVVHVADALDVFLAKYQVVLTGPNADPLAQKAFEVLLKRLQGREGFFFISHLGQKRYLSAMAYSSAVVGNSSSGFLEACLFPRPVVNIGERQRGRLVTPNIVNVPAQVNAIIEGLDKAIKQPATAPSTIYGDGRAAAEMVKQLKRLSRGD